MSENSRKSKPYSRRSIRLKGYDYSQPGMYFVTICTNEMSSLFGRIVSGEVFLNRFGFIAQEELIGLQSIYPNIEIYNDEFVIMPDYIHVILWIRNVGATEPVARKPIPGLTQKSLGSIIGQYKSRVTKRINQQRNTPGKPVWQRNYYDRIIRNEKELHNIKKYITENPLRREEDQGKEKFCIR